MHPLNDLLKKHATDADIWTKKSQELYDSAELVWNHVSIEETPSGGTFTSHKLGHPAQMLMGLSLECVIKGYILSKNPDLIKDGRIDKKLTVHELADLFSMADIHLDDSNISLLNRLTENVVWLAKYNVPKSYSKNEIDIMNLAVDNNDFDQFCYLHGLVLEKLKTTA